MKLFDVSQLKQVNLQDLALVMIQGTCKSEGHSILENHFVLFLVERTQKLIIQLESVDVLWKGHVD